MSRPVIWPTIDVAPTEILVTGPMDWLNAPALAASFGPELSRLAGIRITAKVDDGALGLSMVHVCTLRINAADGGILNLDFSCEGSAAATLLERMFGARAADAALAPVAGLLALPPGSASWVCVQRSVAQAMTRAFEGQGKPSAGSAVLPASASVEDMAGEPDFSLVLDIDGRPGLLTMTARPEDRPAPPEEPAPDPLLWSRMTRARTFDVELPVALRLAERRLMLSEIASLGPGDILPLERPDFIDVIVDGKAIRTLPAQDFAPPEDEQN